MDTMTNIEIIVLLAFNAIGLMLIGYLFYRLNEMTTRYVTKKKKKKRW